MLPGYLGAWPVFVFVWALAVTTGTTRAQTYPTTVEFDVTFPRNETYAPDALLPIVIAIQNPQAVGPLAFSTGWHIYWRGINASSDYIDSGYRRMIWTNYSTVGNEPYYETFYTNALNGTEGQFSLELDLDIRNCSQNDSSLNFGHDGTRARVDFELRNSVQRHSNASIITSKDSCPVGLASFSIKETIKQSTDEFFLSILVHTVALRILAGVTASACRVGLLTSDCPSPDDKSNTAAQLGLRSVGWSGVIVGIRSAFQTNIINTLCLTSETVRRLTSIGNVRGHSNNVTPKYHVRLWGHSTRNRYEVVSPKEVVTMVRYPFAHLVAAIFLLSSRVLADVLLGPEGSYQGKNPCTLQYKITGPDSSNWPSIATSSCCGAVTSDFSSVSLFQMTSTTPKSHTSPDPIPATEINATLQIGSWDDVSSLGIVTARAADLELLATQMGLYFSNVHVPVNRTAIVYGLSGNATFGVYIGKSLQNEGMGQVALSLFNNYARDERVIKRNGLAMQLCGAGRDADHAFGAITIMNGTFKYVQDAIKTWSNGGCLDDFSSVANITAPIFVTAPPLAPIANGTIVTLDTVRVNSAGVARSLNNGFRLNQRAECRTIPVIDRDGCPGLAVKCGISEADFTKYNPKANCAALPVSSLVCCSSGMLPDLTSKPNPDGSCKWYQSDQGDTCSSIAARNGVTVAVLDKYNEKTWGWNGCNYPLWEFVRMCISPGTPPMPVAVVNSVCGPQDPGTATPPAGTDLSTLNPCPLNACCDVWAQCGTTTEFCVDTTLGAPGTAKPLTNGCISNCGTGIVRSTAPAVFRKIGYFQGYNLGRPCLYIDALQQDASYTHIHFGFGTLTQDFQVAIGNEYATYEFGNFKALKGSKRILSFEGWDFSTKPATYMIFRNGVNAANRLTMAKDIANFVIAHKLDGRLLPGKSLSIAAPASYWYLKGFPIAKISTVVDYIVYMTHDLHGQWDFENEWYITGCPAGNCLRSNFNATETVNALSMITKAGAPSNKIVVGVTSYGRSYKMSSPGCYGEMCTFTGKISGAAKGLCTNEPGYISNVGIALIESEGRVNTKYFDNRSQSNILVYDETEWVGYMDDATKASRATLYKSLVMGGTTDWATDLLEFKAVPAITKDTTWASFKMQILSGKDPYKEVTRTGNWSSLTCDDPAALIKNCEKYTSAERWGLLDANRAWTDAVGDYNAKKTAGSSLVFSQSVAQAFGYGIPVDCTKIGVGYCCSEPVACTDFKTGAAGYLILNSLITVRNLYEHFHTAIGAMSGFLIGTFDSFENDFAPVPVKNTVVQDILISLFTLGLGMAGGKAMYIGLSYTLQGENTKEKVKAVGENLLSTGIAAAILSAKDKPTWTADDQIAFKYMMGNMTISWQKSTEQGLQDMLGGGPTEINKVYSMIKDGLLATNTGVKENHMVSGTDPKNLSLQSEIQAAVLRTFYSMAIPLAWTLSGHNLFIIDSGLDCTAPSPTSEQDDILPINQKFNVVCNTNKLYNIAGIPPGEEAQWALPGTGGGYCSPFGPACSVDTYINNFEALPGLNALDGSNYGAITTGEIVRGALATYAKFGGKNGSPAPDMTDKNTVDAMYSGDITTPGYIRLPICGPLEAWANWASDDEPSANYPCN
ncbi:hypothetical protein V496_06715 [Pseudogymnoascus sp. VKM F-4515 (FW-2607)]|nr:hypothetical protein V496_06715 [Pseudogymnoascus sp. VKM F-4515 (FW-2607)]KFY77098.1 hypothetical protein V498_09419 [Pseudogymnoascus sp. VKM F-4517 (FW-2822)]